MIVEPLAFTGRRLGLERRVFAKVLRLRDVHAARGPHGASSVAAPVVSTLVTKVRRPIFLITFGKWQL